MGSPFFWEYMMKKISTVLIVLFIFITAVNAEITIGAKGILGIGAGTTLEDGIKYPSAKQKVLVGGGGGIFVRYNLPTISAFGIQSEFDILANNGVKLQYTDTVLGVTISYTNIYSYTSLELPILGTYDFTLGPVMLTVLAGPHFSFPLGDLKIKYAGAEASETTNYQTIESKVLFGLSFGATVSYPIGPGAVIADLRYLNDFTKVKLSTLGNAATRRTLNMSLGYQIKL